MHRVFYTSSSKRCEHGFQSLSLTKTFKGFYFIRKYAQTLHMLLCLSVCLPPLPPPPPPPPLLMWYTDTEYVLLADSNMFCAYSASGFIECTTNGRMSEIQMGNWCSWKWGFPFTSPTLVILWISFPTHTLAQQHIYFWSNYSSDHGFQQVCFFSPFPKILHYGMLYLVYQKASDTGATKNSVEIALSEKVFHLCITQKPFTDIKGQNPLPVSRNQKLLHIQ